LDTFSHPPGVHTEGGNQSPLTRPRPSLEYSYAFDICASEAFGPDNQESALIISSSFYHSELAARLTHNSPNGEAGSTPDFYPLYSAPDSFAKLLDGPDKYSTIIWAEPQRGTAYPTALAAFKALKSGGNLLVMSSGTLSRFLSESKQDSNKMNLGAARTGSLVKDAGFLRMDSYWLHNPISIIWSYLSKSALMIGRDDLADRFLVRARQSYIAKRSIASMSTLVLYRCKKR